MMEENNKPLAFTLTGFALLLTLWTLAPPGLVALIWATAAGAGNEEALAAFVVMASLWIAPQLVALVAIEHRARRWDREIGLEIQERAALCRALNIRLSDSFCLSVEQLREAAERRRVAA